MRVMCSLPTLAAVPTQFMQPTGEPVDVHYIEQLEARYGEALGDYARRLLNSLNREHRSPDSFLPSFRRKCAHDGVFEIPGTDGSVCYELVVQARRGTMAIGVAPATRFWEQQEPPIEIARLRYEMK